MTYRTRSNSHKKDSKLYHHFSLHIYPTQPAIVRKVAESMNLDVKNEEKQEFKSAEQTYQAVDFNFTISKIVVSLVFSH